VKELDQHGISVGDEFEGILAGSRHSAGFRPVEVHVAHFVSDELELVRIESIFIPKDVVVSWADVSWFRRARAQVKVVPVITSKKTKKFSQVSTTENLKRNETGKMTIMDGNNLLNRKGDNFINNCSRRRVLKVHLHLAPSVDSSGNDNVGQSRRISFCLCV